MPSDDIEYYRIRQRQELLAADISIDSCCRTIHLDLARRYAMRVTELEANSTRYVAVAVHLLSSRDLIQPGCNHGHRTAEQS